MRLFLARHGNTFDPGEISTYVGKRTDLSLVKKGREQARALGEFFKANEIAPDAIYTGELKRQKETAQVITEVLGYEGPFYPNTPALTEIDYGEWEGKTAAEIVKQWPEEYQGWTDSCTWPKGILGGSYEKYRKAIEQWLETLREKHAENEIILGISSGATIRYFYSLLTKEWKQLQEKKRVSDLKVGTGHYCELDLDGERVSVVKWNQDPLTAHH